MTKRRFSRTALASVVDDGTSGIGFGCMGITAFYGEPLGNDQAMELLRAVYDTGCRHFDTAEAYRTGDLYNETVLGRFFRTISDRDSFTVATKYLPQAHGDKNDYGTVKVALEASLDRLGLDHVDLYYCHRITDLEGALEFVRSARRLGEEGLLREVGLSEISPEWLRRVHTEAGPIDALQQEWSLLTRNLEDELVPTCRELGIPIVAYSPLARKLLASRVEVAPTDWRQDLPRYQAENLKQNNRILTIIEGIAVKYGCTPAQLALAWLFKKAQALGVSVVPIPGTTRIDRALSNIASTRIDIEDEADRKRLEELAGMVAGERGTESYLKMGFEAQG
jgi:aryl-alcohol dehydrogenase-like predicted oxidoreductase